MEILLTITSSAEQHLDVVLLQAPQRSKMIGLFHCVAICVGGSDLPTFVNAVLHARSPCNLHGQL